MAAASASIGVCRSGSARMRIENEQQHRLAVEEVQELTGAIEGSPEEARLIELVEAIEDWEKRHTL